MIIKVNDVRGLGQPQATGLNGGSTAVPVQQPAGGKAEPAAVIGLSEAAKVAQALPMSANTDKLDLDLVQEIRQRIADPRVLNPQTFMPAYFSTAGLHNVAKSLQGKTVLTEQGLEDIIAYLVKTPS